MLEHFKRGTPTAIVLLIERGLDFAGWISVPVAVSLWAIAALLAWWLWIHPKLRPGDQTPAWLSFILATFGIGVVLLNRPPDPIEEFKRAATIVGSFSAQESVLDRKQFGNCPSDPCYIVNVTGWELSPKLLAAFMVGGAFPGVSAERGPSVPLTIGEGCWAEIRVTDLSFRFVVDDWEAPEFRIWFGVADNLFDLSGASYMETPSSCELEPNPIVSDRDFQLRMCNPQMSFIYGMPPWPCPDPSELLPLATGPVFYETRFGSSSFPTSAIYLNASFYEIKP